MRLSEYEDAYFDQATKASDIARSLAFAGIALIWVFHISTEPVGITEPVGQPPRLPNPLLIPSGLFALALLLRVVNMWSQPTIAMGGRIIGQLSGDGRPDGVGRCQGSIVAALEIRVVGDRTHIKIETIVGGTIGWITNSFVGKKFDKDQCREHFEEKAQVERCEG
jgi:hypothetical protein